MPICKQCWETKITTQFPRMNARYCNDCEKAGLVPTDRRPIRTGVLKPKNATCHPDRLHSAKGLCQQCYNKAHRSKSYDVTA